MTRDPVGRRGVGTLDILRRPDAGTMLATILVLGLVLRVLIAGVYLPLSGLGNDIGAFSAWGQRLASVGPSEFYEPGYFSDYPPGYLYVLWFLGEIGGALEGIVGRNATAALVKIPGILADVGVAWLLFAVVRRWGGELIDRRRFRIGVETAALAAAAVYLFNPGTIFTSAVWGQIDSVGTLILLATLYGLARGWTELAAVGAVVAMLVKFQFGFLIPVVAIVGLKRHASGRSSDPVHDGRRQPLRVLTSIGAAVLALVVLITPFGMTVWAPPAAGAAPAPPCLGFLPAADPSTSIIGKLCEASNTYGGLSVNAFNIWRNPFAAIGDDLGHWGDDTTVGAVLGGVSLTWQQVGTILFGLVALLALLQLARRDDIRGLVLGSMLLAVAFFALPTRVHERYLFPALALGALLLFAGRAWPWLYAAISVSFFANVYWVYTEDWSFAGGVNNPGLGGAPMPQDAFLSSTLLTDGGIWLLGALITVVLGIVAWRAVQLALTPREAFEIRSDSSPVAPPRRVPALSLRLAAPGWLARNPADAYLGERPRRLDRRDALLLLGLVAFALVFRLWRLDLPRSQHFDEAYHARSAAEFLSAWGNGWDRDVYEWTHPMLAKYLIAGGIVLADPNKVVGEATLDAPSPLLAVAPRRASAGHERSVAFTTDGGSTIVASDAETGDEVVRWQAGGQVAALEFDLDGVRLLVGRADAGSVETFELAGLLASPDGRAPPAGPPIESGLEGVSEIVLPRETGDPVLLRGTGGLAVIDADTGEARGTVEGAFAGAAYVRGTEDEEPDWVVASDPVSRSLAWFDAETLEPRDTAEGSTTIDAPITGPILARGGGEDQQLLALTGELGATDEHPATEGGIAVLDADGSNARCGDDPCVLGLVPLPGAPLLIDEQPVADLIYVAGTTADGEPQVWPIEPHMEARGDGTIGMAAFDRVSLDGAPLAMAFDSATTAQGDDRGGLLVSTAAGTTGSILRIDAGSNAFGWRLAGVVFGALLVGLVYLLVATMFGRRRIAVLAAALVALDPMSYAMSRISMNDIFVATFIVAAYLVFWQIWSGRWARSAWWALPLVGVLIGLAAASKWVGFYALAGLLVLVLARSHLGRWLLVMLAALALVMGAVGGPWPFLVVMLGILVLALIIAWARPIRLDAWEAASALAASAVVFAGVALAFVLAFDGVEGARQPRGAIEYLFGLLARGAEAEWPAWLMIGVAALLIAWRAWRSVRDPRSDARWFAPGEMGGFAWPWVGACLVAVPLVVYGLSYIPYLQLGHDWAVGGGPGYGWSVDELHAQMFGYHFNLTAGHASASPWWSWPLALKPTWFHISNFDSRQVAVIYNGGNPILFWAGIPALVACAVLAWKRRSTALVLVVAAFAFQYVPWIRIERATFAYHYLTALVFAMAAVAYVVDELLRRPTWRDLAIGYLVLAAVVGVLIFPLGSALPMPDWYINAARALPPWNFDFKFPDPPQGDREELLDVGVLKAVAGLALAALAGWFAVAGRSLLERRAARGSAPTAEPIVEGG